MSKLWLKEGILGLALLILCVGVFAQESNPVQGGAEPEAVVKAAPPSGGSDFTVNNTWMMVATFLVFVMHLGFATLESGLTRAKNTVNILFKNSVIPAIGLLTYAAIGFQVMYPGEASWLIAKVFGMGGLGLPLPDGGETVAYNPGYTFWTDFLFQGMFAATAATIVSGAVAERIKLGSFLTFTVFYVALVYPVAGSWTWGGGWLAEHFNFKDFAGSTLVHSVGGWGALAGAIILGPRLGKYVNGKLRPIMGHNLPLAAIGVFLLWLGWFGFNGGSVLSAEPGAVSRVLVTTSLAASAAIVSAMFTAWVALKKPDLTMVLNGCLAGLVGITAGADVVTVGGAIWIGIVAGVIVVFSVLFFDRIKIDDPVGAISVHLICGVWGTLAVAFFSTDPGHTFLGQFVGVAAYGVFSFIAAFVLLSLIKAVMGLRVSEQEELRGLDIGEHGMEAYNGFQIFITQ
ncbi:MAG: ammonium transporter [Verrucomicrobia bacterium]|nr:ammonium transporter [Verrucomicrobiota bacterium]